MAKVCAFSKSAQTRHSVQLICVAACFSLLFLTSCADLSAVAKFAGTAKLASSGFSDITSDFAGSDERRLAYVSDEEKPVLQAREEKDKAVEPEMQAALKVLTDYIAALAAIAADDAKGRDTSFAATEGGLEKVGMSATQAGAGVALATKIAAALDAGYRSNKAGKAIHDCNPMLQEYLKGLEHIVDEDYGHLTLGSEKLSVDSYYRKLGENYKNKEPLAYMLAEQQKRDALAGIDKRRKAATAYVKILTDIGEGHQKLYDAEAHRNPKQLGMLVEPYVEDIVQQSITVAKAY